MKNILNYNSALSFGNQAFHFSIKKAKKFYHVFEGTPMNPEFSYKFPINNNNTSILNGLNDSYADMQWFRAIGVNKVEGIVC